MWLDFIFKEILFVLSAAIAQGQGGCEGHRKTNGLFNMLLQFDIFLYLSDS